MIIFFVLQIWHILMFCILIVDSLESEFFIVILAFGISNLKL